MKTSIKDWAAETLKEVYTPKNLLNANLLTPEELCALTSRKLSITDKKIILALFDNPRSTREDIKHIIGEISASGWNALCHQLLAKGLIIREDGIRPSLWSLSPRGEEIALLLVEK